MCLELSIDSKELLKKARKAGKPIMAFKALGRHGVSPYNSFQYKNGINESDRTSTRLTKSEISARAVLKGFHCYLSIEDLKAIERRYPYSTRAEAFEVRVNPKDIVAFGSYKECGPVAKALVCTKLTIDLTKHVHIEDEK